MPVSSQSFWKKFPVGERIVGEQNPKIYIKLHSGILRVRNILTTCDEFIGNEILSDPRHSGLSAHALTSTIHTARRP